MPIVRLDIINIKKFNVPKCLHKPKFANFASISLNLYAYARADIHVTP